MATESKTPKAARQVSDAPLTNPGLNLYQRIRAVMSDVAYLNKDKQVGDGGYSYKAVSEESVTGTVREKMIKHGLVLLPVAQAHRHEELPRLDRNGKETVLSLSTVDTTYKLVNVDNPAEFELIVSSGTGVDPQDKGVGKAMTYAFKYALLRAFAIPTGNDPDAVHNDELARQQENTRPGKSVAGGGAPASPPLVVSAGAGESGDRLADARNKLPGIRSRMDLTELWKKLTLAEQEILRDEFTAAGIRITAAIAAAATTPLAVVAPVAQPAPTITAPANRPEADEQGNPLVYATIAQREEIHRLLNHPNVSRQQKTNTLLHINKYTESGAVELIAQLGQIADTGGEGHAQLAAGFKSWIREMSQAQHLSLKEAERLLGVAEKQSTADIRSEWMAAREKLHAPAESAEQEVARA